MFAKVFKSLIPRNARAFSKIKHNSGRPQYVDDTRKVELRGTHIQGNYSDLPTLIFFPEACDSALNWSGFFTNPNNHFLDYRNIILLNPRNFGNSDRHPSYDLEEISNDVVRFMYENKISTATLAGHGFGAKVALAVGCYHSDRVTGVIALDSTPMDQRYHEAYQEFKGYIEKLHDLELNTDRTYLERSIGRAVEDPRWRKLFSQNITKVGDNRYDWNFAMQYLHHNVSFNKADSIGYWAEKHGLYTGRGLFIFPEYSRWVHLATNTLPMMKVCPRVEGYGIDIISVQGDENPNNHWIYDDDHSEFVFSRKMMQFIRQKDGVHVLLSNRSQIGKEFIPDRMNSRNNSDHVYSDYSPAHLHHNWRFSNIYQSGQKHDAESKDQVQTTKSK